MTNESAEAIGKFVRSGGRVLIHGPYVDGFANVRENGDGWRISSEVYSDQPLVELPVSKLSFYRAVDVDNVLKGKS